MKKIFDVLLVLLLGITIVSCSSQNVQEDPEENVGMVNPIINYDSIDEINEKVGVHIVVPSSYSITDLRCTTIKDEIAQVDFVLDEHNWTIRGSKIVDQDISGIYDEHNIFNTGEDFSLDINNYYLDRIFVENIQYTIVVEKTEEYDVEKYSNFVFEIGKALKAASDPNMIAGEYIDTTSQRATMTIDKYADTYEITVRWPNSSSEEKIWFIAGTLENNKINYRGEDIAVYSFDDDGNESIVDGTATQSNNVGYFEINNGILYWKGAAENQCKECEFKKMPF